MILVLFVRIFINENPAFIFNKSPLPLSAGAHEYRTCGNSSQSASWRDEWYDTSRVWYSTACF